MINKDFTQYTEAFELKQLEFDEPCLGHYQDRDETTLHGAVVTSKNVYFSIGETNKGFIVRNSPISNCVLAPTYSQAFRWFREKYNLRGFIGFRPNVKMFDYHIYDMSLSGLEYTKQRTMEEFNKDPKVGTYEEAELACLKELIKIVKEGNK
jgi:hypothetical protein